MAMDLKEFIETHQLENVILLGHSMGGKTVLFFEQMYPHLVQKIIVADIAPRAYEPHHDSVLIALNAVDFTEINTRKDAENILSQYISDFGTKQFLLKNIYWKEDETKQMAWRFNLKVITAEYNNISVRVPDFRSDTTTLFIRGEKSNYISDEDEKDIASRFSNYQLKTIANSGHWVHAEQPEAFFNCVIDFIS
jgi:pimeloyl-ACP methyl ester carboxylesterase